jgi:hypothetical protein
MAKCHWCDQEMTDDAVRTCSGNDVVDYPDGKVMVSVAYVPYYGDDQRCPDCHIAKGGKHHPGCDMERCPRCKGQLISCGCLDEDEYIDDEQEDDE